MPQNTCRAFSAASSVGLFLENVENVAYNIARRLAGQPRVSERTMEKAPARRPKPDTAEQLRDEYRFDYAKAKPNRFASRVDHSRVVVALDPDVSEVFTTPDAVNKALRALIEAMPTTTHS